MKHFFNLVFILFIANSSAQIKMQLTPQGFAPLEAKSPNRPLDQLIDAAKTWAPSYNKRGYDISEVTGNSLVIEARNENAFYSYNVGVKYNYDIVYRLKITFQDDKTYKLSIAVKEIYAENVLMKTTTANFFTDQGKLKDDYRDAKPALEATINDIVRSFTGFIAQ